MQQSHSLWRVSLSPRRNSPNKDPQSKFKIAKANQPCVKAQQVVVTGREEINRYVEIATWRNKTSLPILKVEQLKVYLQGQSTAPESIFTFDLLKNIHSSKNVSTQHTAKQLRRFTNSKPPQTVYRVSVKLEEVEVRLSDIQMVSFPQTIHLLKQILVGYEVLIDIFGLFVPTARMIGVTSNHRWKIWINEDYAANQTQSANISTRQFINHLVSIAEQHSMKTSHARQFFSYIYHEIDKQNSSFLYVLERINEFTRVNKILQVSMVTLPRITQKQTNQVTGARLKTDHSNISISPDKNRQMRNKTPDLLIGTYNSSRHCANQMKPSSKISNFSQLGNSSYHWVKSSIEAPSKILNKQYWDKHRPSSNITQEAFNSPKNKIPLKKLQIGSKTFFNSMEFPKTTHSYRLSKEEKPSYFSPRTTVQPCDKKQSMTPNLVSIKNTEQMIPQSLPNLPHDLAENEISITFSRKNSVKIQNDSLSSHKLQTPGKQNSRTSWFSINCQSPNHSSSTKELRNSSEMQPDITSYAKLKEKDLKERIRNNHSVINNGWKMEEQKQQGQTHEKKNLTVSHQFHNRYATNLGKKDEGKGQDQWISTITGLFDDTKSIKHLKESVKFKGKDDQVFEKEHLKNVKLDLLEKFGRKVELIVDEDHPAPRKRKYTENMDSMQLIEEEYEDIKSYLETERKDDDDAVSKVTHDPNAKAPRGRPPMHFKDSKSEYDGSVSDISQVLPREKMSNIVGRMRLV